MPPCIFYVILVLRKYLTDDLLLAASLRVPYVFHFIIHFITHNNMHARSRIFRMVHRSLPIGYQPFIVGIGVLANSKSPPYCTDIV